MSPENEKTYSEDLSQQYKNQKQL